MKMSHLLFALALASICSLASAQWQWLDKDGRKVFSDRAPPLDVLEKDILKRPNSRAVPQPASTTVDEGSEANGGPGAAPVAVSTPPKGSGIDKELEAKKKQAADAEAAKRKAEEERVTKTKIENCARAKQAKSSLDSGVRIGRVNAAGEREVMDDAARSVESTRIQAIIASDCR